MLFGVVLGISGFFQTRESGKAVIDDFVFRLFYGFSCGIIFLCTALIGVQDLVGENIECIEANAAINQYCWVSGTHLVAKGGNERGLGSSHRYGDESCHRDEKTGQFVNSFKEACTITHSYYQWVPYVLFLQGLLFLLPRQIWLRNEEGKLSSVSDGVRSGAIDLKTKNEKTMNVAKNVAEYINMEEAGHWKYGLSYFLAQVLNVVVVLCLFVFNNHFLDGQFMSMGYVWMKAVFSENEDSKMILYKIFPRITKCEFQKMGYAGGTDTNEFLCLLTPNIISEKIFVFLWFWYVILFFIGSINCGLILAMMLRTNKIRSFFMMRAVFSRKLRRHIVTNDELKMKIENMKFGQYLFLYLLGRNVDYFTYKTILELMANPVNGMETRKDNSKRGILTKQLSRPNNVQDTGYDEISAPASFEVSAPDQFSPGSSQEPLPQYFKTPLGGNGEKFEMQEAKRLDEVDYQKTLAKNYPL